MATYYNKDLSLKDQFISSDLIIDGKVIDKVSRSLHENENDKIVQTTYKVEVQEKISGNYQNKNLRLTIVGGQESGYMTPNTLELEKGNNYLMLLGQDYGPDKKKDQFVPYFCSCFKIDSNNNVQCSQSIKKQLVDLKIISKEKELTIKNAAKSIKEIIKRQSESEKSFEKLGENELQFTKIIDEVFEMPSDNGNFLREGKIGNIRKE